MARRTKPPDYHRDLARRIKLIDGTELRTLNDVAEFFYEHFEPGRKWPTLKEAGKLLLKAARSGKVDKSRRRLIKSKTCCACGGY